MVAVKPLIAVPGGYRQVGKTDTMAFDASPSTVQGLNTTVGIALALMAGITVNPYQFGYVDGASPAVTTAAIQAALNSGKAVDLMGKEWLVSGTLTKPPGVSIFSLNRARIVSVGDAANTILQGPTDGSADVNSTISNLTIWSNVTRTGGYALKLPNFSRGRFAGVRVGSLDDYFAAGAVRRLWFGVIVSGSWGENCWEGYGQIVGCQGDGLNLSSTVNNGSEFTWTSGRVVYCGTGIRQAGGVGGLHLIAGGISHCDVGLVVDSSAGLYNRELFVASTFAIDASVVGDGVNIQPNSLFMLSFYGWSCGHKGNGATINAPQPAGFRFMIRGYLCDNYKHGLADGLGGFLAEGTFCNNGRGGTGHGVYKADGNTLFVDNALIQNNGYKIDGTPGTGAAVYVNAGGLQIGQNIIFQNNVSGSYGGNISPQTIFPAGLISTGGLTLGSSVGGVSAAAVTTWGSDPVATPMAGAFLQLYGSTNSTAASTIRMGTKSTVRWNLDDGALWPSSSYNVGKPGNPVGTYYGITGTIQSSDADLKSGMRPFSDDELDAWGSVNARVYQFLDAIAAKGADKARWHFGYLAQDVRDAFEAKGLDPYRLSIFCADPAVQRIQRTRKAYRPVLENVTVIEDEAVRGEDGTLTVQSVPRVVQRPVMTQVPRFDADGKPVLTEVTTLGELDAEGRRERVTRLAPDMVEMPLEEAFEETFTDEEPLFNADGSRMNRLGLRYDGCAVIEGAWARRELARMAARLSVLEQRAAG